MNGLYRDGVVHADTLEWEFLPAGFIRLTGEIALCGEIVVAVDKTIRGLAGNAGDADASVQTLRYAYNAHVRGHANIRRDDNAHRTRAIPTSFTAMNTTGVPVRICRAALDGSALRDGRRSPRTPRARR